MTANLFSFRGSSPGTHCSRGSCLSRSKTMVDTTNYPPPLCVDIAESCRSTEEHGNFMIEHRFDFNSTDPSKPFQKLISRCTIAEFSVEVEPLKQRI